jgi:hypothetical protein
LDDFNAKLLRRLKRLEGRIRFGSADDVREEALTAFYEQMYPERAPFLTRHWRWLYQAGRENAFSSPILAIENERIVGHGGMIKVTLQRGAEQREAVWMMDFAILPEYQRGMVGGGLVQTGCALCPLQVAFLNERSWGMVSKLGWQTHFPTTAFQLPLHPEKLPYVQSLTKGWLGTLTASQLSGALIRSVYKSLTLVRSNLERLPANAESLKPFTRPQSQTALYVPRTAEFLNWRILSHPHADEYFVLRPAGSDECLALMRVMDLGDYRRLHFLALQRQTNNARALSSFFAGVVRWALSANVDHIIFVSSEPEIAGVAARWLPFKSSQRFAYHANDEAGLSFLQAAEQRWELLDSDFEMMLESKA